MYIVSLRDNLHEYQILFSVKNKDIYLNAFSPQFCKQYYRNKLTLSNGT